MIKYISDLHFNHYAVIGFDNRPFTSIAHMNNTMIQSWNAGVGNDDEIYIVGDLAYKGEQSFTSNGVLIERWLIV